MDLITLQFLQNKLEIELSAIRQEFAVAAEEENPEVSVNFSYDELSVLRKLVVGEVELISSVKQ